VRVTVSRKKVMLSKFIFGKSLNDTQQHIQ